MPRNDNYPENIRSFDNDPRSPFYEAPECKHCESEDVDEDNGICNECGFDNDPGQPEPPEPYDDFDYNKECTW
jgi:hypothetical protein